MPRSPNRHSMSISHTKFNTSLYTLPNDKTEVQKNEKTEVSMNEEKQTEKKNNNFRPFLVLALLFFV